MAALTKLIQTRAVYERFASGSGLEKGQIFSFTPGPNNNGVPFPTKGEGCGCCSAFCFQSPGYGTAIIEVWGAGGSGSRNGCCAFMIPGNPGAYARKTICMEPCGYVCGCVGQACGNADGTQAANMSCRGCSCPTNINWYSGRGCCEGVICAMGGRGGWSLCQASANSGYCCFLACQFCGSQPAGVTGVGCGLICNYSNCATPGASNGGIVTACVGNNQMFSGSEWNVGRWMACAYGGDVNCCGGFSCALFLHCNACCKCCHITYVKLPHNMWTEKSSTVEIITAMSHGERGMQYLTPWYTRTAGLTRSPTNAMPLSYCYTGAMFCGCYQTVGCNSYLGVGVPGFGGMHCATGVCDLGLKGGTGGVRITWIQSDVPPPFTYDQV
jgi:hypothetical protein